MSLYLSERHANNKKPERFNRAMSLLNRYGPEEGLQRLKETDPALAMKKTSQIEEHLQNRQTGER